MSMFKRLAKKVLTYIVRMVIGGGLVVSAVGMFYFLMRYTSTAPSLFFHDSAQSSSYIVWFGFSCAGLLRYLCGIGALLIPIMVGCAGIWVVRRIAIRHELDRIIAFIVLESVLSLWYALGAGIVWRGQLIGGGLLGVGLKTLVSSFDGGALRFCLIMLACVCVVVITRLAFVAPCWRAMRACIAAGKKYRVLQRVAASVSFIALTVWRMMSMCARYIHALWRVVVPDVSVIAAREYEHDQSIETIVQDVFWQEYKHDQTVSDQPVSDPEPEELAGYQVPDVSLFIARPVTSTQRTHEQKEQARVLEEKLAHFGIHGSVCAIKAGPLVTCFEYEPAIDTKLSKLTALEDELSIALQATSLRIVAPIPGTSVVGIEVANKTCDDVLFARLIHEVRDTTARGALPLLLGCDSVGKPVIVDLATLPHVLLAGATGSGKSVAINSMIVSLIMHKTPDELSLVLIDPKQLEFACYEGIAHLRFPIITSAAQAISALTRVIDIMNERYQLMARVGVRSIAQYHARGETERLSMPYIVVVIDELADLMLVAGKQIEWLLVRIAQMARAAGIHLIVATQRPSVDIITGIIKVNFVSRIALRVSSSTDSRVILDATGAHKLLGRGDMLMLDAASGGKLMRLHGAYITNDEIARVVAHIKAQRPAQYSDLGSASVDATADGSDPLYQEILQYLEGIDEVSISLLQRRFRIGYNRSARIIDTLECEGHIVPGGNGKTRKVVRSR